MLMKREAHAITLNIIDSPLDEERCRRIKRWNEDDYKKD